MLLNIIKNFFTAFYSKVLNLILKNKKNLLIFTFSSMPFHLAFRDLDNFVENKALILLKDISNNEVLSDSISDNISEAKDVFPWLYDENGNCIDYTKKLSLFDGVNIIARYLETRYQVDRSEMSDVKLSEALQIFEGNNKVTVLDLYNHVSGIMSKDKNFFKISSETLEPINTLATNSDPIFKPLGSFGEITLNDICNSLVNLKWDHVIRNTQISINVLPAVSTAIGYGFILKAYLKHIYYKDLPTDLNQRKIALAKRRPNLAAFALLGAPLTLGLCKYLGSSFGDIVSVSIPMISDSQLLNNNIDTSLLPVLVVLKSLYNKIPSVIKFIFKLAFLIILILKLLGVSILTFLFTTYYYRTFLITSSILMILYQLLSLFLLNKFYKKTYTIPKILPSFLINWLKEFEILSGSTESFSIFKQDCYIQICLYLVIIVISILIF